MTQVTYIFPNSDADTNDIHPRVGLLSLTNATRAMQELNDVRALDIPLSSGNSSSLHRVNPGHLTAAGCP